MQTQYAAQPAAIWGVMVGRGDRSRHTERAVPPGRSACAQRDHQLLSQTLAYIPPPTLTECDAVPTSAAPSVICTLSLTPAAASFSRSVSALFLDKTIPDVRSMIPRCELQFRPHAPRIKGDHQSAIKTASDDRVLKVK